MDQVNNVPHNNEIDLDVSDDDIDENIDDDKDEDSNEDSEEDQENDLLRSPDTGDEDLERQARGLRREIEGLERVDAALTAVQLRSGTLTKAE